MIWNLDAIRRLAAMAALLVLTAACSPPDGKKQASPTAAIQAAPASAPAPAAPASGPETPPTADGVYVQNGACPGEGCYLTGKIKAYDAADLYDKVGADAAIAGRIEPKEWVEILDRVDRLVPRRGVVRKGGREHAAGDVVYMLGSSGEGCSDVWDKGKLSTWCDTGEPEPANYDAIDWERPVDAADASLGLWVQVKRTNGQVGWLHDIGRFGCTGYQDRDDDCPPLPH